MNPDIIDFTRMLRKESTPAEQHLWKQLRRHSLPGEKFYRQFAIEVTWAGQQSFMVVDFIHRLARLVIEVDGLIHMKRKEEDDFRTMLLTDLGYKVIRFTNQEVLENTDKVIIKIKEEVERLKDRKSLPPTFCLSSKK